MATPARRLVTNFSKGELTPLLECHPDLAQYFEGGSKLENVRLLRQGGLERRPGLRKIAEVKSSANDTILLPMEVDVNNAYVIEVGNQYFRFFKNKAPILTSAGGAPVEVAAPYLTADIRMIHYTQSVDVLFLFHGSYQQQELSHVSDLSWVVTAVTYSPPPSFEADTDISGGAATLTPGATSGTNVLFTASVAVFLQGDIGRNIRFGVGLATITGIGTSAGDTTAPNTHVRCNIINAFANTNPIPAGSWLVSLSPQCTLTPSISSPAGATVTCTSGVNAFRAADVGKFIKVYSGVIQITAYTDMTHVTGTLLSILADVTTPPPSAAPAGAWTLEVNSWTAQQGYPATGEFFQGRLMQAGTSSQRTTLWGSASDDFHNYAIGKSSQDALEYTVASRQINLIRWLADNNDLFVGTAGSELRATGDAAGDPLGGNVIPSVNKVSAEGCAPVQPIIIEKRTLFMDRSQKRLCMLQFDILQDGTAPFELTVGAEHIMGSGGAALGPIGFAKRPDKRLYFVRSDGQLVALTFMVQEKVIGFTRYTTNGLFQAVAVIPQAAGLPDQVWVVVQRTINGQTKRFVELFEDSHELIGSSRPWTSLQTDCATVVTNITGTSITGLNYLEGMTVDIVLNGNFIGTAVVTGGTINLPTNQPALVASDVVEIGLDYVSTITTMRPAIEGQVIEGIPRSWSKLFVRLYNSWGGQIKGSSDAAPNDLQYPQGTLDDAVQLFTGDTSQTVQGNDTDGRVTVIQNQPYPMTVLGIFGTLQVSDHD